jgi:two-component system clock-associated histidine kinase SasA
MDRLHPIADSAQIVVRLDAPDDLPDIAIDAEKVERVMVNLIDNALRYTPQGGNVTMRIFSSASHQDVQVIDSGPGIPGEFRERIFERFFQIKASARKRGTKGSGLGLTFCRLAVEAHRGRIWVDDGPDGGAAFHFTLPTNLKPDKSAAGDD